MSYDTCANWFVKFSSKYNRRFRRIQTKRTMLRKISLRREAKNDLHLSVFMA